MNIGNMNQRITIQKQGEIQYNENGFPINEDGFSDYRTIWASANNLFGKEFWSAKAVQSENTIEFIIRYSNELAQMNSAKYRIFWKDRVFNITFIDNIKYENKWLKIKAIEVAS